MSSLIIYFSRTGGNYVAGDIRNLEKGNTEIVAEMIQKLTGAELFEAEPVVPYSDDYSACIEEAKNDKKRDARPELKKYPEHMESFEKIYLATPTTGEPCPWPCSHCWSILISRERRYSHSVPTRAAAWEAAPATSDVCVPAPTCGPAWPSPAPAPRRQKRKLKSGF